MTQQSTFMITAVIRSDQLTNLQRLLRSMNQAPGFANPRNRLLPYWQMQQLHVARFTILQANTNDDIRDYGVEPSDWPPTLCFIGDVDGAADLFLAELVIRAEPGLREIFSHCEDFESDCDNLLQWLHDHSRKPSANYINWRGRTVLQAREEQALSVALRARLNDLQQLQGDLRPRQLRRQLQAFVTEEIAARRLRLSDPLPAPAGWHLRNLINLVGVPLALLLLAPLMLLASPFYFARLRQLEESDPENTQRPERSHLQALVEQEDIDVSNHFNVFGQVKPGRLRLFTIKMGLLLLDYTSRHIYKRGYLTRVQTIHFARWVLLDNNRRVYFASNYDGSADSYMDDFINKVAWGLNLVFSNGVGYPRTRWLLKGGAEYEQKYKRTLRRNQLPSESWYKAYPGLTAYDLARNSRIRAGLEAPDPSDSEIRSWLALL
ncbi:hypothetical protein G8764_10230 [Pseudomaricurvus alcaniphilus]|uniref:hypothetical protein n=1 Tax=Pseudomaricurvus alcaniphilus TaxID=1166482 RepID=UPI00140BE464|nr:hypothetical protein [Pseudomaricurvus alcaniphilus]NHN37671.1 hypothetical protein [Pseudomaricurvus alcaniphilus]